MDRQVVDHHYQGLYLATPDGKVLAVNSPMVPDPPGWPKRVLEELTAGLKQFGNVTPRPPTQSNPLPYRGIGVGPDGSVTLAMRDRVVSRNRPEQLFELLLGSVTLPAADWSAIGPPDAKVGGSWTIPKAVGGAFYSMLNLHDVRFHGRNDVTDFEFTGKVTAVQDGIAYLNYRGRIRGHYDERTPDHSGGFIASTELRMLGGVGAYDLQAGQMLSLTWVFDGSYWLCKELSDRDHADGDHYVAVVEWRREKPNNAIPPLADTTQPPTPAATADSGPAEALKAFLVALAAQDEPTLRALALPHPDFDLLLRGPRATPEQVTMLKARLADQPIRRLKSGDPVKMPNGESRVISPDDVREGRVVLWPEGAPLPTRLENVGGKWKVFAGTFIAARR